MKVLQVGLFSLAVLAPTVLLGIRGPDQRQPRTLTWAGWRSPVRIMNTMRW
jgi:hypothetical protein